MTTSPLVATTDLSEEQILERATVCARGMQRAGAELLVLAYEWAVAHPADRLDPAEAGKPGRERATILGGPGTPEVTEFAAAEFGARIGRTSHHGRKLMAGALDIRIRLPLLWGRVQALDLTRLTERRQCERHRADLRIHGDGRRNLCTKRALVGCRGGLRADREDGLGCHRGPDRALESSRSTHDRPHRLGT